MTLVILAAGIGSRYGGLKQLDPITENGEFIIDFSVFDAIREGFDHVVFITKRENLELFHETIGARIQKHVKVTYCFQDLEDIPKGLTLPDGREKPLGTGHALLCARDAVKDNFAVINADDFYGRDAFAKLAAHLRTAKKGQCCMVGYRLSNTLSENGSVSRGECQVGDDGHLISVTERTSIVRNGDCAAYTEGGETVSLPLDTTVSMNCWGLTPDIFERVLKDFEVFIKTLPQAPNPLKKEFYLPYAVEDVMKRGEISVDVYKTNATWYGVTYREDKAGVEEGISAMIRRGEYPPKLWN